MQVKLTPEQLAEIANRANAATSGPWFAHNPDDEYFMNAYVVTTSEVEPYDGDEFYRDNYEGLIATTLLQSPGYVKPKCDPKDGKWDVDAEFIAKARADIPALLAHIAEVEAERDAAQRLVDEMRELQREMAGKGRNET